MRLLFLAVLALALMAGCSATENPPRDALKPYDRIDDHKNPAGDADRLVVFITEKDGKVCRDVWTKRTYLFWSDEWHHVAEFCEVPS